MTFKIIRPQTIEQTSEFSRASTATYYDQDGVLQTAAVDELRIGYDPSDLDAVPLPVLEDAATNLLPFSNSFENAAWVKTGTTVSNNVAISPDGALNADALIENSATSEHYIEESEICEVGFAYAASFHVKQGSGARFCRIRLGPTAFGATAPLATFDLANLQVVNSSTAVVDAGIELLQNGFYRVWLITTVTVATNSTSFRIYMMDGSNATYTGDGASSFIIYGAQLEKTQLTSYIATSGAAATRAADNPGDMLSSSIGEDDHPEYDAGDTYALGDRVISTTTHRVYESLQAGNLGNPLPVMPEISTAFWLNVSATNRWKMFDNSITSQSSAAEYLSIAIQTVGRVDSVALLNISASSVRITMEDATEGIVYDETYSLIEESGILDYYEYFFEPVSRVGDFAITDMDLYSDTTITITLSEPGGTVLCGAAIVGLSKTIGATRFGMSLGIQDYSVKITDEFGNKTILERVYSDKMSLQVSIPTASVVSVKKTLASYRATAIVYIATDEIGAEPVIAYGYFNDFNEVIDYLDTSVLNIEIESLT
jgi:hypothetical protein